MLNDSLFTGLLLFYAHFTGKQTEAQKMKAPQPIREEPLPTAVPALAQLSARDHR